MLKLFESRNKKISHLVKLGDYLGHSLRENVQLFTIDGIENKVSYITEGNYIIEGNYRINNNNYLLENIQIQDSSVFNDDKKFDAGISNQISLFLENLYRDEYAASEDSFEDVIDIMTSRSKYASASQKLQKKINIFESSHNITGANEFNRLVEIIPELVSFLSENKKVIQTQVPEINNSLKLSEAVAEAFSTPRLSIDDIKSKGKFEFLDNSKKSIYEMICKQELVKKEILEAKNSFDLVWASEPVIDSLASKIYADTKEIENSLTEALKELPYLALVSKKKLFETLDRNLGHSSSHISEKELKSYVSTLFEMKKPAKKQLTQLLSEKYGVNLQYLKDSYSFKSLINTQVVLFESLSRVSPTGSVIRQVLSEFSTYLKDKNGVEGIDLNNMIQQIFQHAGYSKEELPLMEMFSFDEVKKSFEKAEKLVNPPILEAQEEDDAEEENPKEGENGEKEESDAEKEEEEEEDSDEEAKGASGEVQEEEIEDSETQMSDEEVVKAIKSISDIVNGTDLDIDDEEDTR